MSSLTSTAASLLLLLLLVSGPMRMQAATIRDYVNSAAHYVGMDSLISEQEVTTTSEPDVSAGSAGSSGEASAPVPRCCDLAPQQPSPCAAVATKEMVVPIQEPAVVIAPVPAPCPVVVPEVPRPACTACPIDYESANAKSHSKMWEVALKGKALASTLTHALASPIVFTNTKISEAASFLPGIMSAKGRILGSMVAVPIQFAAAKSSLLAKGVSGVMVGVPVAIGTGVAAGVSGLMEKVADIGRQEEACLCAQQHQLQHQQVLIKEKKEEEVKAVPCPCQQGGLLAAGSRKEEKFSIDEPVTDSAVTEAFGGNQGDSQESVTDSTFTTIAGETMQEAESRGKEMMGMPVDRMLPF